VSALKGFSSSIVDFDQIIFEDGANLFVVGEEVRFIFLLRYIKES